MKDADGVVAKDQANGRYVNIIECAQDNGKIQEFIPCKRSRAQAMEKI